MIEYMIYRFFQIVVLAVPLRIAYWISTGIACLNYHLFCLRPRRALEENLRNVFKDWSEKQISECVWSNFVQFGKFIVDFFHMSRLNSENIGEFVEIGNKKYLDEVMIQKRRGVIALTAHLGNWELGGVTLALLGHPISAVALSHEEARVDAIFVGQRAGKGVKVIPLGRAGRDSYKALIRGEMIALLGDRDVTSQGIETPFFGKMTPFPRGTAVLAVRTRASILPGFVIRQGNGRCKLLFEKPFHADLSKSPVESEKDVLRRWISILEKYILLYPEQWFMYHRVWDDKNSRKSRFRGKKMNGNG